jgi:uncharacterized protein (DUF302 family)
MNRAAAIIHTNLLLHISLGTLSMAECLKVVKDYLESKGAKVLSDLPVSETLDAAVEICKRMNDAAEARRNARS